MGDVVFVLLVVAGLGTFFYRQNQAKHVETSQDDSVANCCATHVTPAEEPVAEENDDEAGEVPSPEKYDALTWRVLQRVMEQPGIIQTEIYAMFPRENRKHLQATLLQLDKENVLKREKEGNTYRLYPV